MAPAGTRASGVSYSGALDSVFVNVLNLVGLLTMIASVNGILLQILNIFGILKPRARGSGGPFSGCCLQFTEERRRPGTDLLESCLLSRARARLIAVCWTARWDARLVEYELLWSLKKILSIRHRLIPRALTGNARRAIKIGVTAAVRLRHDTFPACWLGGLCVFRMLFKGFWEES